MNDYKFFALAAVIIVILASTLNGAGHFRPAIT
jgi:hypothetical protein